MLNLYKEPWAVKKIVFSVAVSLLVFVLLPVLVIAVPTPIKPGLESTPQPIGLFEISILKDGQWQQAGILAYSKFLREETIDLGQIISDKEKIHFRLTQKSGGAAHIDAVSVGGTPPSDVNGSD